MVRREPRAFGIEGTRWTLARIQAVADWLRTTAPGSLHRLLARLEIVWKRARSYVHSPDPDYVAKLAEIDRCVREARASGGTIVALFEDECTIYRQPTLAQAYEARGHVQPLARHSWRTNTKTRLIATLDGTTGRVVARRRGQLSVAELVSFYQHVCAAYPDAERSYLIQDNWPVHSHPDVLVALEPQPGPFALWHSPRQTTEPTAAARRRWGALRLPIQLVPLPTYASWANPIEKLWRQLKQEVTHLHRWADDLETLRTKLDAFFDQYAHGSLDLMRYTGLLVPRFNC